MVEVLVDARNVLRSRWPNIPEGELVDRCVAWAAGEGVRAVVVFDGRPPDGGIPDPHELVGTGASSADDWIVGRAAALRAAGAEFWLVSSDRELRRRAGAARTIGGGAFVGLI